MSCIFMCSDTSDSASFVGYSGSDTAGKNDFLVTFSNLFKKKTKHLTNEKVCYIMIRLKLSNIKKEYSFAFKDC